MSDKQIHAQGLGKYEEVINFIARVWLVLSLLGILGVVFKGTVGYVKGNDLGLSRRI